MTDNMNKRLVLIAGESGMGKSASLMGLRNPERVVYLNCESGKDLPFPNKFYKINVTDPELIPQIFDVMNPGGDQNANFDTIVIDTLTFMMDMYESVHVIGSSNTMAAWGNYNQFFKNLMQDKVASSDKAVLFLAHTKEEYDEKLMGFKRYVPVKGSLKERGIEAFFSIVVAAKRMEMKQLESYIELQKALPEDQRLLRITEEDEDLGYKHVFQTRPTKQTTGDRIRSPMGLFSKGQTFMDNNAQLLLDHLHRYYNS